MTLNDLVDDLRNNLWNGSKLPVMLIGTMKNPLPIPCIKVVPVDGDADFLRIQVWVCMDSARGHDLRAFMAEQLPWLLAQRKNHYGTTVWKYRNFVDRETPEQEGQQNYIKMGLEVRVPKYYLGASWNIG